jgi:hypothetical protein
MTQAILAIIGLATILPYLIRELRISVYFDKMGL